MSDDAAFSDAAPAQHTRRCRKRIAYLSGAPRVSTRPDAEAVGPRAHVVGLIDALQKLGCDVRLFIAGDRLPTSWAGKGSEKAVSSRRFETFAADMVRLVLATVNKRRAWKAIGPDVEWAYERAALFQGVGKAFQERGIPWILETNALLFREAKGDRNSVMLTSVARSAERRAYMEADCIVCVSKTLKDLIVDELDIDPAKVLVIPNGVDTRRFDPSNHQPRRRTDRFTVGFVGTLYSWQGVDDLLRALHPLQQQGLPIGATIVGEGQQKAALVRLSEELRLNNIDFVGLVPPNEIPSNIARFDIGYCGPNPLTVSRMYHSPLKLFEYMSMAVPVVASRFEASEELIRDNETGFLYAAGNVSELTDALRRAYLARESLPDMGAAVRTEVVRHHDWLVRADQMISSVERFLSGR